MGRPWTLLLVFLAACGENLSDRIPTGPHRSPQEIIAEAELHCPEQGDCPEGVGLLLSVYPEAVGLCTAFLVAPDRMLTNAHCIDPAVRQKHESCAGKIKIVFAESPGHPKEEASCAEIIDEHEPIEEPWTGLDYAFIRLDRAVARTPYVLSRGGIADEQEVVVVRANPTSADRATAVLGSLHCKAIQGTLVLPEYDDEKDSVVTLGDCPIRKGNSGSPVLDAQGQVRGVIQQIVENLTPLLGASALGDFGPMAVASNVACFPGETLPSTCAEKMAVLPETDPAKAFPKEDIQIAAQKIHDRFEDFKRKQASQIFGWESVRGEDRQGVQYFSLQPACIKPSRDWASLFKNPGALPAQASIEREFPLWKVEARVDAYYRPVLLTHDLGQRKLKLEFQPQLVRDHRPSMMTQIPLESASPEAAKILGENPITRPAPVCP